MANADIPGVSRTDYGYDWVGNRTSPTAVYNDADQLTSYAGNTYSYNTYGDMISGAGRTYTIADSGKVWRITCNSVNYDNAFNANDLRYNTNIGGVSTNYIYDTMAGIPAVVAETNGSGNVTSYYVREPSGELVMRQNGTDQKYYYFDELGSTLFLTDASGVQTDKYVYNSWGKVVSSSGSTVNPFKFVGRLGYYSDSGTGLMLLGRRFYDPEAGVFTQRDPVKDGLSYYTYTSGSVMTAVDPWGLSITSECQERLKNIYSNAYKLIAEKRKYDPVEDGKGGHYCPRKKTNDGKTEQGGHYNEMKELKNGILRDIKWYREHCKKYDDNGTGGSKLGRWVFDLVNAYIPPPVYENENKFSKFCKKVATGAAAIGGGYIAYRCARMLPSLAPPLWGTIPLNAACP